MEKPLDGVRVLDLGQIFMGPYCGMILAYLGAEVIKIEPPTGENVRNRSKDGHPPAFQFFNTNKEGVVLDLKSERGKEALKKLITKTDVLIENFRPGVMERLDLGYEELKSVNENLVYAHGSGYGDTGPYASSPAMDLAIQARGGVMSTTGFPNGPPIRAGPAIGDILGGIHLVTGILSALYDRERTGHGQYVEVGMMDCIFPTLASSISAWTLEKDTPERTGNRHAGQAIAPYNAYEVADGYVVIMCITEAHWDRLTKLMEQPELASREKFKSKAERAENISEIDSIIEKWLKGRSQDDVVDRLLSEDIPCAPVQSLNEVISDPQLHSRDMVNFLPNRGSGREEVPVPGLPIKFTNSSAPKITPAPTLGENTTQILQELGGYTTNEIRSLQEEGII